MTIIRRITAQDIRLKEKIAQAAKDANLNLSEVLALNNQFGTTLEYIPKGDVVEITRYLDKSSKGQVDEFAQECLGDAFEMVEKLGKGLNEKFIVSSENSLSGNVKSALQKLKQVL